MVSRGILELATDLTRVRLDRGVRRAEARLPWACAGCSSGLVWECSLPARSAPGELGAVRPRFGPLVRVRPPPFGLGRPACPVPSQRFLISVCFPVGGRLKIESDAGATVPALSENAACFRAALGVLGAKRPKGET